MYLCKAVSISLILAVALFQEAFAGAWLQDKGAGIIISGSEYNQARLAFDNQGNLVTPVDFEKIDSSFYAEYGLTDKITLVGNTALQDVSYISSDGPQQFSGFATSKIGLRLGSKFNSNWALSVQPSLIIPAGGEAIPDGDLGIGGLGAELRLAAGRGFSWRGKSGFFGTEAAYDWRGNDAPRQIMTDVTLGIEAHEGLQILGQAFYTNTNDSLIGRDTVLANESLKLQASVVFEVSNPFSRKAKTEDNTKDKAEEAQAPSVNSETAQLQIGFFQTVYGRNIVREQGVVAKLWNRF